jgi:NSS family neurotransmitter:Na+ symporter
VDSRVIIFILNMKKEDINIQNQLSEREVWKTKFGLLIASVMTCVGTGNIWRFPYLCAKYGGAAFLFWYIISVIIVSIIVLQCESCMGKSSRKSTIGAFTYYGRSHYWRFSGWYVWFILTVVMIYYNVVVAWILRYAVSSIIGTIWIAESEVFFNQWVANPSSVAFYLVIVNIIIFGILYFGVQKGIERVTKILAPILFLLLILCVIRAVTLPKAAIGINFYLAPDWSMIWKPETITQAMGQAFWSTAAGTGTWIVLASYTKPKDDIAATYVSSPLSDAGTAFLAGFAIMPVLFSFGVSPESGTGLSFIVLPKLFAMMPLGKFIAACFFFCLLFAGISSAVGSEEPTIAGMMDEWGWSRKKSVLISFLIYTIGGLPFAYMKEGLDWMDLTVGTFGLMIGCLMVLFLVGYKWGAEEARTEVLNPYGLIRIGKYWNVFVRYISPLWVIFGIVNFYLMWIIPLTTLPVKLITAIITAGLILYTFYKGLTKK